MGAAMNTIANDDREDDWLEGALRADAREHLDAYVADDGFTARVMNALPAPAVPAWRKPAVLGMWIVAAAGAAVSVPDIAVDVGREAFRLLAAQPISLPQIGAALGALALATWAAAAYALRSD
jgi:hypothetical protein